MSEPNHAKFSHLDDAGRAHMVDVGNKSATARIAIAEGQISFSAETLRLLTDNKLPKGDVLTVAKIAGILAAKRTSELVPLCHPLPISYVDLTFEIRHSECNIHARTEVRTTSITGVEMEALTAVSVALLTIYDMTKSVDKTMVISNIRLLHKKGGKSGVYDAS
ncbi:MAG: cyclic pyranopterin monophosphate synthase MoaC [Candidatus Sumerlaeaceae bacterium]